MSSICCLANLVGLFGCLFPGSQSNQEERLEATLRVGVKGRVTGILTERGDGGTGQDTLTAAAREEARHLLINPLSPLPSGSSVMKQSPGVMHLQSP